jgi:hypothetical protein
MAWGKQQGSPASSPSPPDPSLREFEYTAISLSGRLASGGQDRLAEQVNKVAAYGWRLVQVADDVAYFERPVRR